MSLAAVILCAGNGTRMNSNTPKVLHKVAGFPLIQHVMSTVKELELDKTIIVAGKEIDKVSKVALDFDKEAIIINEIAGVYASQMKKLIESNTGMHTSL